ADPARADKRVDPRRPRSGGGRALAAHDRAGDRRRRPLRPAGSRSRGGDARRARRRFAYASRRGSPMTESPTSITLDPALARAGPAAESFARLWRGLWRQDHIPPELLELCRLTFARLHDAPDEIAAAN